MVKTIDLNQSTLQEYYSDELLVSILRRPTDSHDYLLYILCMKYDMPSPFISAAFTALEMKCDTEYEKLFYLQYLFIKNRNVILHSKNMYDLYQILIYKVQISSYQFIDNFSIIWFGYQYFFLCKNYGFPDLQI